MLRFGPALLAAVILGGLAPGAIVAGPVGEEGCTARYWRTHLANWPVAGVTASLETDTITPRERVRKYFYTDPAIPQAGHRLRRALGYEGGPSVNGTRRTLLRVAVAAMLNAADDRIAYPLHRTEFLPQVRKALASGDRSAMRAWADRLRAYNKLGCTLS